MIQTQLKLKIQQCVVEPQEINSPATPLSFGGSDVIKKHQQSFSDLQRHFVEFKLDYNNENTNQILNNPNNQQNQSKENNDIDDFFDNEDTVDEQNSSTIDQSYKLEKTPSFAPSDSPQFLFTPEIYSQQNSPPQIHWSDYIVYTPKIDFQKNNTIRKRNFRSMSGNFINKEQKESQDQPDMGFNKMLWNALQKNTNNNQN